MNLLKTLLSASLLLLPLLSPGQAWAERIIPDSVVRKDPRTMQSCRNILRAEQALRANPDGQGMEAVREILSKVEDLIPTCQRLLHPAPLARRPVARGCTPGVTRWVNSCSDCVEGEVCGPAGYRRSLDWYCGCLSH